MYRVDKISRTVYRGGLDGKGLYDGADTGIIISYWFSMSLYPGCLATLSPTLILILPSMIAEEQFQCRCQYQQQYQFKYKDPCKYPFRSLRSDNFKLSYVLINNGCHCYAANFMAVLHSIVSAHANVSNASI